MVVLLGGLAYVLVGAPAGSSATGQVLASSIPVPTPPPPLEIAAVHATADAVFTRTPGALIPPTPPPPRAPALGQPSPSAAAKPAPPGKPAGTPTPALSPTAEPTEPPTRTPTVSPTPSATPTYTATVTPTPLPSPCDARTTVPRLAGGNGFYVSFTHEVAGDITVTWPPLGGRISVYSGRPAEFGNVESGEYAGFPSAQSLAQGIGSDGVLNLPGREPGLYTVFFFNPTANGIGPEDAVVHYWTYGHCP